MKDKNGFRPKLGDICLVDFSGSGSVQTGIRPAIIFQNDIGNKHSPNVTVIPMTTKIKKTHQPTHVVVKADETGLKEDSMALCENPICISKSRIIRLISKMPMCYMKMVAVATMTALGIQSIIES